MKKILLLSLFTGWIFAAQAQQPLRITGIVADEATGEAIAGVSVAEAGTTNGALTGVDGSFALTVRQGATLTFSYMGYQTLRVAASDASPLAIRLSTDSKAIDEVVVVGYSVQKKRDITGAVSKVDGKDLHKIPTPSAQLALQGRIAGVHVSNQTGAPGAPAAIRIRGVGSISSSNEPLYIVDGIPVESGLSNIAPSEIESISVLKDASSAAIYGSRANNGVVLITTTGGKAGEHRVTYNAQAGVQRHGRLTPMTTTGQYIELYNEAAAADNVGAPIARALIEGSYLKDFPNVNHVEEIFQVAPLQSHEVSVSGGSEKTQYLLALSYFNQAGIIKHTGYDRLGVRTNVSSKVKDWLQAGLNMSVGSASQQRVSSSGDGYAGEGGSVVRYAFFRNPAIPVRDDKNALVDKPSEYYGSAVYDSFFGDGYNPVGLAENTDMTENLKSLLVSGNVLVKLPFNFSIKGVAGVDYSKTLFRTFNQTWGTGNRINAVNSLDVSNAENMTVTANATLNHSFRLTDEHSFSWFAGTEAIRESGQTLGGSEGTLTGLLYLGKGQTQKRPYQSEWDASLLSFFGSLSYSYSQKYYVTLLLREDGSSRFAAGNRWGTFYSVSGGWNVESEAFMQPLTAVSKLKLRAGYGAIGNQNIGLYANLGRYSDQRYYTFGGAAYNGYILSKLGNSELKWETSRQVNAGVDLELWKGSLGVTIDYFYKITDNMLVEASYPPSVGSVELPWVNNGSVLNAGVDAEVFYRKNYARGGFNVSLNGGFLHNEVISLDAPIESGRIDAGVYATRTEVGRPIGSFYLYEMEGIFQNEMEVLTSAYQGRGIKPGDVKYKDNNKDGAIDAQDRAFAGSAIPTLTAGLNLSGAYRQWDVSLFFQGAFGQKIYAQVNQDIEGFYRGFNVTRRFYDERWQGEGTSSTQPRASWSGKQNNARAGTTRFLEDGSYVRLKNIQVGYTVPNTQKVHIEAFRIYAAATNLWTLTGYSGLDPEMTVSTNSLSEGDRANGIDWGTYPVAMCFTLGLNVTF
ncbi:MAG: TonB-dependent receptor [Prevotellaceae bacterium]|jgi:TonB-linked SusC/RagA family outer membrane protein|nr:TonB-dependent receptor [Prevotellaceae bacterium]